MWIFVKEIVYFQITPVCSGCLVIKYPLLRAVATSQKTVETHLNGKDSQFLKVFSRHLSSGKTSQKPFKKFSVFSMEFLYCIWYHQLTVHSCMVLGLRQLHRLHRTSQLWACYMTRTALLKRAFLSSSTSKTGSRLRSLSWAASRVLVPTIPCRAERAAAAAPRISD